MLVFSKLKGTKSLRFQIKQIIVSVLLFSFLPKERSFCRALLAIGSHLKRGKCASFFSPMKILILEILVECYIYVLQKTDCITCSHALERKRKGIEIEHKFGRVRSFSMHVSFTAEAHVYQTVLDSPVSQFVSLSPFITRNLLLVPLRELTVSLAMFYQSLLATHAVIVMSFMLFPTL